MTAGLDTLRERVTKIDNAQTAQEAFELLCDSLALFRFEYVFAGRGELEAGANMGPTRVYFAKSVEAFIARYVEKRYMYVDPVVAHLAKTNRPFRWRDSHNDLTPEQQAQVEDSRRYGLHYGLTFPIVTSPGLPAIVSMGRETDFSLSRADMIEIELLCCFTFEVIESLLREEIEPPFSLTQKEHEVLDLVGKGKTNWEIGQIMSISEYSVRDYLKNLAVRFETSNRTHTVVKAIQLGLLRP